MDAVQAGQLRPPRHARWAWPRSPWRCGAATCATTRPIRSWLDRDRFVLSQRPRLDAALRAAAPERLRPADRRARSASASCTARRRATPRSASRPGVETTTGPLGQGLTNAVGMALAEKLLADEFNRPGHDDRRPPHLRLPRRRLPDGRHQPRGLLAGRHLAAEQAGRALRRQRHLASTAPVEGWFRDDTPARFRAYGWNVIGPIDGHDVAAVGRGDRRRPRQRRQADADRLPHHHRPRLARPRRHRQGARRAARRRRDRADPRGASAGPHAPFEMPDDVARAVGRARTRRARAKPSGTQRFAAYRAAHPALAAEFERRMRGRPAGRLRRACAQAALDDFGADDRGRGLAQGLAEGARRAGAEGARDCSAAAPT